LRPSSNGLGGINDLVNKIGKGEYGRMKTIKKKRSEKEETSKNTRNPGCANFDFHYECCLFRDECLVLKGHRCEYFERAVLPTITDNTKDKESD
jgi:hypothetical protein